jgi:glycosyltransferase involved in cell wall biosynthesis
MDAKCKPTSGGRRFSSPPSYESSGGPLVSVITAVVNGQPHVTACLESVLLQDYPNIEHLVLDGVSSDGTVDVLRAYGDRIAYWKSEPDNGVYDAWNKGLREARGEWICFLGSDDVFLPGAVKAYMELAATNPDAEYLSSQVKWVHPSGYHRIIGKCWKWNEFCKRMTTAHVGSMHRRSLYDRLGQYDTSYRSAADYELLLRTRGKLKAAFTPALTVTMTAGGVSCSREALNEEARAKVATGGRSTLLTALELRIANVKYSLRPLRYLLGKKV